MAGKPARDSQKSEKLHFRVTPELKAKLEIEAAKNKRNLSAECEHRLWVSMEETDARASYETEQLLHAIKLNIFEIEQALGTTVSKTADGKAEEVIPASWKRDIATWTAVRDMLFWGPINELKITDTQLAQRLDENAAERSRIRAEKQRAVDLIFGLVEVQVSMEPQQRGILPLLIPGAPISPRQTERSAIEASHADEGMRNKALELMDALEDLDGQEQDALEARAAIVEPIKQAIEKGRATYIRPNIPEALGLALELLMLESLRPSLPPRTRTGMIGAGAPNPVGAMG